MSMVAIWLEEGEIGDSRWVWEFGGSLFGLKSELLWGGVGWGGVGWWMDGCKIMTA